MNEQRLDTLILNSAHKPIDIELEVIFDKKPPQIIKRTIPQAFHDLSSIAFQSLVDFVFAKPYNETDAFYKLLQQLINIDDSTFFALEEEQIKDLRFLINPFIENEPVSKKSFVPVIELKKTTLQGPSLQLSNFVLDEYIYAEAYYNNFTKDKSNITALNKLIALLYRDKSIQFDEYINSSSILETQIDSIDLSLKHAAYFSYMAQRNYIAKRFYKVFQNNPSSNASPNNFGWRETTVSLAGEKFGKPHEVRNSLMLDVFVHLFSISK